MPASLTQVSRCRPCPFSRSKCLLCRFAVDRLAGSWQCKARPKCWTASLDREHGGLSMEPEPNILLMRLKSMGDVLFTLPAVHLLRESFPRARITFLVSAENAPLLEGFREVDETIVLDRARYRSGNPLHILAETFTLFRRLRRGRFSLVVDFQGYGETAWLARLSGAPQRWASVHSTPRHWAYTRSFRLQQPHSPRRVVSLAAAPVRAAARNSPQRIRPAGPGPGRGAPLLCGPPARSGSPDALYSALHQHPREELAARPLLRRRPPLAGARAAGPVRRRPVRPRRAGAGAPGRLSGFRRRAAAGERRPGQTVRADPGGRHGLAAPGGGDGKAGGGDHQVHRARQQVSFPASRVGDHASSGPGCFHHRH